MRVSVEPFECVPHRLGDEATGDGAAGFATRDQSCIRQNVEMLHDGGQRHRERPGKFTDRQAWLSGEPRHQRAPRRVGERGEGTVEAFGWKVNHVVYYSRARDHVKSAHFAATGTLAGDRGQLRAGAANQWHKVVDDSRQHPRSLPAAPKKATFAAELSPRCEISATHHKQRYLGARRRRGEGRLCPRPAANKGCSSRLRRTALTSISIG